MPMDGSGTEWHAVNVSEHDRDALTVAVRLVRFAKRERLLSVFRNGAGRALEPDAVAICLERMANDWDAESANESDTIYPERRPR